MAFTASYTALCASAMVRIVFGPSVAIPVVVSAQLATGSARAPQASNNRVIAPSPRTSLLILLAAHHAPINESAESKRPIAGAAQLCGGADRFDDEVGCCCGERPLRLPNV